MPRRHTNSRRKARRYKNRRFDYGQRVALQARQDRRDARAISEAQLRFAR